MERTNVLIAPMDKTNHKRILEHINVVKPTETIKLTGLDGLYDFASTLGTDAVVSQEVLGKFNLDPDKDTIVAKKNLNEMPSDIVLWGQLPSPNLYFDVSDCCEAQVFLTDQHRIIEIFKKYMEKQDRSDTIETIDPVGVVRIYEDDLWMDFPISFGDAGNQITLTAAAAMGGKAGAMLTEALEYDLEFDIMEYSNVVFPTMVKAGVILSAWYTAQVLLLNPLIKIRYKTIPIENEFIYKNKSKPGKKQPKKYIKQIIFENIDELNICGKGDKDKKHHEIHEPIWWVQGHWREYKKTGKRIFIQGYWKGPDKYKKELTEPREREF